MGQIPYWRKILNHWEELRWASGRCTPSAGEAPGLPSSHACRASHLCQRLHMDDVDEAEEEGHLCGHLGDVGKQAALGQDLGNWGWRDRGVSTGLEAGLWLRPGLPPKPLVKPYGT